jgi:hypothetical protein
MFFRLKKSGPRSYLQIVENRLVENRRDGRAVRQHVIATRGRIDELAARGGLATLLATLLASGARFCEQVMLLSALEDPSQAAQLSCKRIGGPLLFGRLWERLGIADVLRERLAPRAFEFALERAVFVATLHRLFVSGSDRDCASWMQDYAIPGSESLSLHHFYRAMAWLGEELPEERQDHATPFSPRTVKDEIEEALFARHRDLFTDLSVVFMDTTSLSFEGEGGDTLGAHGYSKDHRPDLKQMILAVVVDGEGRPICTEMMPGNTADVSVLVPVIDRLRHRFGITRACVGADRGMISEATIAALEERGLEYVLGVRERTDVRVYKVLDDVRPFTPLLIERARGETQLFVKEVKVEGIRYIAARNEAEAEKDAADRATIIEALDQQLKRGDKALIGNSAYRRYLRTTKKKAFEIDIGKVAEEARYDGIFVLRTNARITPLQAVLRYRELLTVEALFRAAKASFDTRPVFHSSDAAIRGHVFCSFLALLLQKELFESCAAAGLKPEWAELLRDLDRLQEATVESRGKTWAVRTEATGAIPALMKFAGITLPARVRATSPPPVAAAPQQTSPKRRGRPRRSATRA